MSKVYTPQDMGILFFIVNETVCFNAAASVIYSIFNVLPASESVFQDPAYQ